MPCDRHSTRPLQRARANLALVDRTHRTQTTTFCDEPSLSGAGVLDRDGGNMAVDCGRGVPKPPTSPTLVSRAVSNPSLPLTLGDRARSAAAAPRSMIEPVLNETSSTLASTSDESVSTLRMASAARAAALARNAASDGLKTSESLLALERIEGVRERLDWSAGIDERGVVCAVGAGGRLAVAGVVRPERVGVDGPGVLGRPAPGAGREGVCGRGIVARVLSTSERVSQPLCAREEQAASDSRDLSTTPHLRPISPQNDQRTRFVQQGRGQTGDGADRRRRTRVDASDRLATARTGMPGRRAHLARPLVRRDAGRAPGAIGLAPGLGRGCEVAGAVDNARRRRKMRPIADEAVQTAASARTSARPRAGRRTSPCPERSPWGRCRSWPASCRRCVRPWDRARSRRRRDTNASTTRRSAARQRGRRDRRACRPLCTIW